MSIVGLSQTNKILYVDSFDHICGIKTQEDSLFKFTKNNNFNTLYLYDLNTVTQNKTGKTNLGNFIQLYHLNNIKCIGIAGDSQFITGSGTNSRKSYQDYMRDSIIKRLDGINLEREFWRYPKDGTCTFPYWLNTLADMQYYCTSISILGNFYIGQLNDKEGVYTDSQVANYLIRGSKSLLLSNYTNTSNYKNNALKAVKTRLIELGTQAKKQNKTIEVIIIFNGSKDYMNSYFKNHTILETYNSFLDKYNNTSFTGKSNIKIVGYALYSYQEVRYIKTLN